MMSPRKKESSFDDESGDDKVDMTMKKKNKSNKTCA